MSRPACAAPNGVRPVGRDRSRAAAAGRARQADRRGGRADRDAIAHRRATATRRGGEPVDIRVPLRDGRQLSGTVRRPTATCCDRDLLPPGYKQRMSAWVRLVAATASHPERELRAVTVGRASGATTSAPLRGDHRRQRGRALPRGGRQLEPWWRCSTRGCVSRCRCSARRRPPSPRRPAGHDPVVRRRKQWASGLINRYGWFSRENEEPEHQLVLGGAVAFDACWKSRPGPKESGDGWASDEPSRLGRLARRLWDGLLDREQVSSR